MRYALLLILFGCLTGCGHDETDRTTGGAATGAGSGAVIGLVGGPVGVIAGALIGAGVGAASGAAVPEKHLDLGPPPWSDHTQTNQAITDVN
jgi:hypothetical protein